MISRNLRHFRVFLAVVDCRTPTAAAEQCSVSQPAVTQALAKLERGAGGELFKRTRQGFFLNERGKLMEARLRRAMDRLDATMSEVAPRLTITATYAQLQSLIAMSEAQSYMLAARNLGLAQPTVHRAVSQIEKEAACSLFERTSFGLVATRPCREITQAARLAFAEFDQADADLAEFDGREAGSIRIGALPLSRVHLLPEAIARFRTSRPKQSITVIDGTFKEMLAGTRKGDVDFMIGALRDPPPVEDVDQEPLFEDHLVILARPGHELEDASNLTLDVLVHHPWVVPRPGTPTREQFDALFNSQDMAMPDSIVECGSIILMRELLTKTDLLGCISGQQARRELQSGALVQLQTGIDWPGREIGLTYRSGWVPTKAQGMLLDQLRQVAAEITDI
ncbi:MAG: LysR family transcriptional regulator [Pseudomonadota bacterium]